MFQVRVVAFMNVEILSSVKFLCCFKIITSYTRDNIMSVCVWNLWHPVYFSNLVSYFLASSWIPTTFLVLHFAFEQWMLFLNFLRELINHKLYTYCESTFIVIYRFEAEIALPVLPPPPPPPAVAPRPVIGSNTYTQVQRRLEEQQTLPPAGPGPEFPACSPMGFPPMIPPSVPTFPGIPPPPPPPPPLLIPHQVQRGPPVRHSEYCQELWSLYLHTYCRQVTILGVFLKEISCCCFLFQYMVDTTCVNGVQICLTVWILAKFGITLFCLEHTGFYSWRHKWIYKNVYMYQCITGNLENFIVYWILCFITVNFFWDNWHLSWDGCSNNVEWIVLCASQLIWRWMPAKSLAAETKCSIIEHKLYNTCLHFETFCVFCYQRISLKLVVTQLVKQ